MSGMHKIDIIDSHTGGEPTRVVLSGMPDLGNGSLADRCATFHRQFDPWRRAITCEPRGSTILVGARLLPPRHPAACAGVIFFNSVGYLGMCGHGTIGVARTLLHLGRVAPGRHLLETPVGVVGMDIHPDGRTAIDNVESYRLAAAVAVSVPGYGVVRGDIAWGGNWFYLVEARDQAIDLGHVESLTDFTWRVRQALNSQGYPEVDHVELFGPSPTGADCRNFVLCPGKAYDRSPCGTGTSAKLACLAADGALDEGEDWIQESVIGSSFSASFRWLDRSTGSIAPVISGRAYVNAESTLLLDASDPFCWGIR